MQKVVNNFELSSSSYGALNMPTRFLTDLIRCSNDYLVG